MDQVKELLEILKKDGRRSNKEIAVMLNTTEDEIAKKIRELEKAGIIRGYNTVIDRSKFASQTVTAMIEVTVSPQREVGFDSVAERIYRYPEVRTVYLMSGGYDLIAIIEGENLQKIADFVARRLSTIEGVTSTRTHFMLKAYKKDGLIFDDEEADRRIVVSL